MIDNKIYTAVQWGTGSTGHHALRQLIQHPKRKLIGLGVSSAAKEGKDASELCGLDVTTGIRATRDLDALLALKPDCLVYMGTEYGGRPEGAVADDLCRIAEAGVNVVNTADPRLIWPNCMGGDVTARLDAAGKRGNASIFTTGVEPGYLGDALPLTLTSLSERVDSVRVEQRIDETDYREELEFGLVGPGATPEDDAANYPAGIALATWQGVLEMFAAGMQIELDEIKELREIAVAPHDIAVGKSVIPKGRVAGARIILQGILGGVPVIEIDRQDVYGPDVGKAEGWPQPFPGRQMTRHTRIIIEGTPRIDADIDLSWSDEAPTISGIIATAARVTNAIPWVYDGPPGVLTNLDLPGITGAGTLRAR